MEWNDSFRLFLLTRNPYPVVPPDAAALVATVNFSVTRAGLVSQLLGLTIQKELPELEASKSKLLAEEEALKVQLAQLERLLLQTLASSSGNILENKTLLQSLNETKEKSSTIAKASPPPPPGSRLVNHSVTTSSSPTAHQSDRQQALPLSLSHTRTVVPASAQLIASHLRRWSIARSSCGCGCCARGGPLSSRILALSSRILALSSRILAPS